MKWCAWSGVYFLTNLKMSWIYNDGSRNELIVLSTWRHTFREMIVLLIMIGMNGKAMNQVSFNTFNKQQLFEWI